MRPAMQEALRKQRAIITSYVNPPVPYRDFDWAAWDDGLSADTSPVGRGATEEQAIAELLELMEDAQ